MHFAATRPNLADMTNRNRNIVSRVFPCLFLASALALTACPGNSDDSTTDQPTTASEVVLTEPTTGDSISATDPTTDGPHPTTSWGSSTSGGELTEGEWTATVASDGGSGSVGDTTDSTTTSGGTDAPQWCEPFEGVECSAAPEQEWCSVLYDLAIEYGLFDPYLQILQQNCRGGYYGCDLCFYAANVCVQLQGGEACEGLEEQCRCLADEYGELHP